MKLSTVRQIIHTGALTGLILTLVLAITGCNGKSDASDPASSAPADAKVTSDIDVATAKTPAQVGQAVADLYISAFKAVNDALADHPPADEAVPLLREVHDQHVTDLVTLGRRVERMSASDKAIVQSAVSRAQSKLQYDEKIKPIYAGYTKLNQHYISTGALQENDEFRSIFTSFNILTQYAFFDLLKKQKPAEAKRLGIE